MQEDAVQRLIDAITRRDIDAYAAQYSEEAVAHYPLSPEPIMGREAIRESEAALFDAFSEIEVEVVTRYGNSRGAVVEVVLRATNTGPLELGPGETMPATQRRIELPAAWIFEFGEDGLIVAERDYFDTGGAHGAAHCNGRLTPFHAP
jgi:hypothetical protein